MSEKIDLRTSNVGPLSRGNRIHGKCQEEKTKEDSKAQTPQATKANSPSAKEEEVAFTAHSLR